MTYNTDSNIKATTRETIIKIVVRSVAVGVAVVIAVAVEEAVVAEEEVVGKRQRQRLQH